MRSFLKTEPVMLMGAVQALLAVLLIFSIVNWTTEQSAAVQGLIAALLAVAVRHRVSPVQSSEAPEEAPAGLPNPAT